jgi:hypothetical protein
MTSKSDDKAVHTPCKTVAKEGSRDNVVTLVPKSWMRTTAKARPVGPPAPDQATDRPARGDDDDPGPTAA